MARNMVRYLHFRILEISHWVDHWGTVYGIDKAPSPFGAMASHVKVSDPRSAQKISVCLNWGIQMANEMGSEMGKMMEKWWKNDGKMMEKWWKNGRLNRGWSFWRWPVNSWRERQRVFREREKDKPRTKHKKNMGMSENGVYPQL